MATSSTALQYSPNDAPSTGTAADVLPILHLAAHQLRQPLSSVESIAFYLKMLLARSEPKLCVQADRIEELVHQANWVLTDTIHALQTTVPAPEPVALLRTVRRAAYEIGREEHRHIAVTATEDDLVVLADAASLDYIVRSTCRCVIRCGQADCSLHVHKTGGGERALLAIKGLPAKEDAEKPMPLAAGSLELAVGGVRRTAELNGGLLRCDECGDGRPRWEIELPLTSV